MTTGAAWIDGRSRAAGARQAQAASGELWAGIDGSGWAWLTRRAGTSKAGQTNGRADGQADGPNRRVELVKVSYCFKNKLLVGATSFS